MVLYGTEIRNEDIRDICEIQSCHKIVPESRDEHGETM
jgi:hypothetical protein